MGFGTLFIGYFLLLNLTYYGFTDCLAALIMLLGLVKLSRINRHFRVAATASICFAVFGLGELVASALEMLHVLSLTAAVPYISMARILIICVLNVFMLLGMERVSREVKLEKIPSRCRALVTSCFIVYGLWVLLEAPFLGMLPGPVQGFVILLTIISRLLLLAANLVTIYGCYMWICMPGNEKQKEQKPSRFGFVNEYRARRAEKEQRDAEYRAEQLRKKQQRRKKK